MDVDRPSARGILVFPFRFVDAGPGELLMTRVMACKMWRDT